MISARKRLGLTILVVGLGLVFWEWRLLQKGQSSLDFLRAELVALENQTRKAQANQEEMATALAAASRELAALQAGEATAGIGREAELRAWLKQTSRIRQLFEQHPDQAIPELSLLTPLDWLRLTHEADLDSETGIRKSLSAFRTAAKLKIGPSLTRALPKYMAAHDDQLPGAVGELSAYLDEPLDSAILSRYGMKLSGRLKDLLPPAPAAGMIRTTSIAVIAELAPIDEDFDARLYFYGTSSWGYADWTYVEYGDGVRDAQLAFARANGGALPRDGTRLLPFITSPSVRELVQATAAFSSAHNGAFATDASQLQPYLTSPEAKALAEKTYRKK